jgi:tetrapyrrole methylase family protein/MazG family protein
MTRGITVVGLGPGEPGLLTREAWLVLDGLEDVFLRTSDHPVVPSFPDKLKLHPFDDLYQKGRSFEDVYSEIIDQVFSSADSASGVVYAVPGDPMVGEATVSGLLARAREAGMRFDIVHGISFIEPCLQALGVDALDGL